ncbi:MAG: general secretion pathway protein GspK [Gallionellales bacterium CG_4_9_14_0_8_um_filter_55_61]|nr:MAG: general secretion pathway protein GspK [Gallionellales bacterium CG_4_9_14_0_8_um_filter_55_61]
MADKRQHGRSAAGSRSVANAGWRRKTKPYFCAAMKPAYPQRGVAIIMVMLIVALATVLAAYLAQQQQLWQRQVASQFDHAEARRLGIAGVDWARAVLADDARANSTDHAGEMWTLRLPAMPVDNGEVIGIIEDRQGMFNLNSLVRNGVSSAPDIAQFQRLLGLLDLPGELALALADWIDDDSETQYPGGAEDGYYLSLPQPYRSANHQLVELGELSRIKGFDQRNIERLRPFVSVLPLSPPINANFASAEVFAAVIPGMSLAEARVLVQQRRGKPYKNLIDFQQRLHTKYNNLNINNFSVSSDFFWVTGRARVAQSQVTTQALLQRNGGWPDIVWQNIQ